MKNFIFPLLLAFVFATGCEENRIEPDLFGVVKGIVVDDATGLPLSGATVTTAPASDVLTSSTDGTFLFNKVEEGTAVIRAELSNYTSNTESVTVYASDTTSVTIRLKVTTTNNQPPVAATYLTPTNLANQLHPDSVQLKWNSSTDPNTSDILKYTVILFQPGQSPDTVAQNLLDTSLNLTQLKYSTDYSWQVVTQDTSGALAFGQVWQFSTRDLPNLPILFARNNLGNYDIWGASADGIVQLQLTRLPGNQWRPRRNPQGTRIAFLSDQGVQTNLYTMANDGSDIDLVSVFPVSGVNDLDLDFCWNPDGSSILFMSNNKLYTIAPDGSDLSLFSTAPLGSTYTEVDWSGTTGHVLARLTGTEIYNSQFIRYSNIGFQLAIEQADQTGGEGGPDISLLGDKFLYTRDTTGFQSASGRMLESCIFIKNKGGNNQFNASVNKAPGTNDLDARYSANGSQIIFVNTDNTGTGVKNICTIALNGLQRKVIITNGEMPDWQ